MIPLGLFIHDVMQKCGGFVLTMREHSLMMSRSHTPEGGKAFCDIRAKSVRHTCVMEREGGENCPNSHDKIYECSLSYREGVRDRRGHRKFA